MYETWASSDAARKVMQGNVGAGTKPELAVRKLVHAAGLRYRVNQRPLPALRRTADLVFRSRRIAIFIDGCYWHGCPAHFTRPATNSDYWDGKIGGNIRRDRNTNETLRAAQWTVLRFWEHEQATQVAAAIVLAVRQA